MDGKWTWTDKGPAKTRKQNKAISGLLRLKKTEDGTGAGQEKQAPEAFPRGQF